MTRKDYVAIAAILRLAVFADGQERRRVIDVFARLFEEDNPNFNRSRFIDACQPKQGVSSGG